MIFSYNADENIKNYTDNLDDFLIKNFEGLLKIYRKYYIAYYYKNQAVLYLWVTKKILWIYFKDSKNLLKELLNKVPKGVTRGFNKRLKVANNANLDKAKKIILKYITTYFNLTLMHQ